MISRLMIVTRAGRLGSIPQSDRVTLIPRNEDNPTGLKHSPGKRHNGNISENEESNDCKQGDFSA
jgi:hypothetical protein